MLEKMPHTKWGFKEKQSYLIENYQITFPNNEKG